MRKGFTLVELLAVIVILAIILVIAIPQIMNIIKNVQDSAYESNKQMMTEAAKIYMANNIDKTFNEVTTISLEDLKNNGYIKEIKDSKTGNICSGIVTIVKNENNEYEYTPYLECDSIYELTHYNGTLLNLDNPKGEALKNLKIYGNTVQKNLPEGYTELEYIESTGTQYINTNVFPNANTKMEVKYQITDTTGGQYMGSYVNGGNTYNFLFGAYTNYELYYSNKAYVTTFAKNTNINTLIIDGKNKVGYYNSNSFDFSSYTYGGVSSYPITLFGLNRSGTVDSFCKSKLYYAKFYDNGVLTKYFIPVKRDGDNVIGLYDIVNNDFYTNSGTGTFVGGTTASLLPNPDHIIKLRNVGDSNNIKITSVGKNFINTNNITVIGTSGSVNGTVSNNNGNVKYVTGTSSYGIVVYSGILEPGTYSVSLKSDDLIHETTWGFKTKIDDAWTTSNNNTFKTFTLTKKSNVAINFYIGFPYTTPNKVMNFYDIQLELNEGVTSYEPYMGTEYNISLSEPLRYISDTVKDYIDFENNRVVRKVGKAVFNGTETWMPITTNPNGLTRYSTSILTSLPSVTNKNIEGLSSHYKFMVQGSATATDIAFFMQRGGTTLTLYLYMPMSTYTTSADFQNYLTNQYNSGTPLTVYYPLEEPIYENIELPGVIATRGNSYVYVNDPLNTNIEFDVNIEKQ